MHPHDTPHDPNDDRELIRWLDRELSAAEAAAVERRLRDDPGLQHEAEVLSELEQLLEHRPVSGEAPDVRAAVLARVERDLNDEAGWRLLPRGWRTPLWAASWVACGIVLAFVILGLIETRPGTEEGDSDFGASFEMASAGDLSFADMIDQALETPGEPVDSMTGWLEESGTDGGTGR